jgi:hypothetical protein
MIRRSLLLFLVIVFALGTACSLLSPDASFSPAHPQDSLTARPQCSTCHESETLKGAQKPFASFDHNATFVKDHKFQAGSDSNVCASCHSQSFCTECHTGKTMMKPSTMRGDRPDREMPHRGDYMTMHKVDGRNDPTGCFKCHGRANNDKCLICHK